MKYISKPVNKVRFWLLDVVTEIQKHFMSVVFVLIIYIMLWFVPQVNDLIIVVNQTAKHWIAVPVFFMAITVFAFFISVVGDYFDPPKPSVWNSAIDAETPERKLFSIPKDAKEIYLEERKKGAIRKSSTFVETQQQYIKRVFPKMLGATLILTAAFAVNNTFQTVYGHDIIFTGNWGFLIAILLMLLALNQKVSDAVMGWLFKWEWLKEYGPIILMTLCFLAIIILGFFNRGGTEGDSKRLFWALTLLAVLFLLLTLSYNKLVLWFKKHIGGRLTLLFITVILVSYLILVFYPTSFEIYTPLSIIMICIIGIYTVFNIIRVFGKRLDVPLLGFVFIVSVVLGVYQANRNNFKHYDASYTTEVKHTPNDRMNVDDYIAAWISDRRALIQNQPEGEKFPIIMVSAEGGGSRAGLWSFLVQSSLFDKNPDYFEKYLFSMTGASGGGGGNNMFYAQAYELLENPSALPLKYQMEDAPFDYRASSIYNKDYLSASVASLLGRDLFKSITNIGTFRDRGAILEIQWEDQFDSIFERDDNPLGQAYLNLLPKKGQHEYIRPILITNTTELQSGERAIISPVSPAGNPNGLGVFSDLLEEYPKKNAMIKRSTAMSMNARFPYVSPVARIDSVGQFGDAGYYNNIGGNVTVTLAQSLERALAQDSTLTGKYEIRQLLITNFSKPSDDITYSSQMLAPLSMIASATFAHPKQTEATLVNVHNIQSKRTPIPQQESAMMSFMKELTEDDGEIEPIIPLGRFLSEPAVRSMEARLAEPEVQAQLVRLLSAKDDGQ
ncbi:MAG: hypothetical protein KTR22_10245 [Flavobacteriaceae bacterium]|nr:hypothetical protein [Flavobacteriaceae bacterium]